MRPSKVIADTCDGLEAIPAQLDVPDDVPDQLKKKIAESLQPLKELWGPNTRKPFDYWKGFEPSPEFLAECDGDELSREQGTERDHRLRWKIYVWND